MQKSITRRIIYARILGAFLAIYLLLMTGFSIFVISEEKQVALMELGTYAAQVNNLVANALEDHIDSNNRVTDLVSIKKELIKSTPYSVIGGTEMAVFTGDYQLLFHTNEYWIVNSSDQYYEEYGYINPREWFSDAEITELEYYLTADLQPKKAGGLWYYVVHLQGFWLDQEMVIPDKITVNPMYAETFDEQGNARGGGGIHTNEIVYASGYENTGDLPYFEHGSISPAINSDHSSQKQAELRQLVADAEKLKIVVQQLEHPIQRIALTTYRYYLPMPFMGTVRVIDDQKYYSDFWTVLALDINMWERCSTTLIFVGLSCLLIFLAVALILSRQTYKTYREGGTGKAAPGNDQCPGP